VEIIPKDAVDLRVNVMLTSSLDGAVYTLGKYVLLSGFSNTETPQLNLHTAARLASKNVVLVVT
jgi:hypothetical protein